MDNNLQWQTLFIDLDRQRAEAAALILAQISGQGVQTEDSDDEGMCRITCYIEENPDAEKKGRLISELVARLAETGPARLSSGQVLKNKEWCGEWKKQFKPFKIGKRLVIRPTWEDYQTAGDERVLILDPGLAFGTGHHESTSMALELIDSLYCRPHPPATVLDLGCGTGILAIACAILGATDISAIDNDPDAVAAARDNIMLNNVQKTISVSMTPVAELGQRFDLVCANIIHNTLVELAQPIGECCDKNGFLLLAGILRGWQEDNITRIYRTLGFSPLEVKHKNEWAAMLMTRGDS